MTATAEGVEDGRVEGTGHGVLPVGREGVGCDTLGGRAAYIRSISLSAIHRVCMVLFESGVCV